MKKTNSGFTLIELIVAVGVAGIVMGIAIPSFQSSIKNNRITSETNRLVSDIQLARSEAMKRSTRVILCRSAAPTVSTPTCSGTANTWSTGWLVFTSGDANNTYESATDTLLKIAQPVAGSITIRTNSASNKNLEFNADASTNEAGGTARFSICDERGTNYGKQLDVPPVGRPRLQSTVSSCTSPV
ncbi:hypothetical protein MNBD_GAMMA16-677 [hydrothermal vent metagenome]|uniref:General secretion pathway GspH domain-containing protein n=1 Tax=hydrothermal vent metagenome TaxID=652676 RepID=A0A3B1A602_9ZZZZ